MGRLLAFVLSIFALAWSASASAHVTLSFQSFNGSVFFGRYPHTFIVLDGTLDSSGERVHENYGFTAAVASRAVLDGPVKQKIQIEPEKYVESTNRHFSVQLTDAQYWRIKDEVAKWRDHPGPYYDLKTRNCIHFVGAIAQIVGIRVDYPAKMLRRPKEWLNHIAKLNPQLRARQIR